jgi:carboxypeptidase Taq
MPSALDALKERLAQIKGLQFASSALAWEQETYMPPGAAASRAQTLGTLSRTAHELFTSQETERLLSTAEAEAQDLDPDGDDARLLALTRRDYEKSVRLPAPFVAELRRAGSYAVGVWQEARRANDFARLAPHLDTVIRMQREKADYLGYTDHPYDALLDQFEPEMKTAEVRAIFDDLREKTVPLVRAIAERGDAVDDSVLHQPFEDEKQWVLMREVSELCGYDYHHGRIDRVAHPFCSTLGSGDVRITVRTEPNFFNPGFFAAAHETGHALYNQGLPAHLERTPLFGGASSAFHESQSRLWENLIGRSREFWHGFFPRAQAIFPEQLGNVDVETFYRAVNCSTPSMIRVEADEVTYNLHIMLRFDLEVEMLEGDLDIAQLPARWNEKMEAYLGIVPETDAEGVMQDMHWSSGLYGYFPTYSLGNLLSVQLYEAAKQNLPDLAQQITQNDLQPILGWMREKVHRHGRKFLPQELAVRATGQRLTAEPYVNYLQTKYGDIYGM